MAFHNRTASLQNELRDGEAAVFYPGPNTRYLAGIYGEPYDRHLLLAVPDAGDPWFVTPRKSLDLIRDESWVERTEVLSENDPGAVARRLLDELPSSVDRLYVDALAPYGVTGPLTDSDHLSVESASPLIEPLRLRKGDEEVEALKRAGAVADEVSEEVRAMGSRAVGTTESELADEIRGRLHAKGGTRLSFDVVVAASPNAARPYYRNGDRRIREGEPVILDFGAFVDGYAGDQTRTVVFDGDPPTEFERAYDVVREAFEAGVDAVEPGATTADVHRAATDVLVEAGFEDNIVHGTGHGVGVEAHEAPSLGGGDEVELAEGMVFSVEPGLYFEGRFGVRIEDLVVVTGEGGERLNDSAKTWRPL